ncbi:MAG: replication factor C large subunit [Aigarchaeota archaeon]|nr:replication factor C large subunit [Aigarchaeota archaeon]MDW7986456.1 replication factor C large subunit [Nitrososphaerota archaeon]
MTHLWVEKYRPKKVSEVVGNEESVKTFLEWMESWESNKPTKKAVLLYGPAGVGKTSLVLAYGREHGYDIVEVNASDWRNEEKMKSIVGESSHNATLNGSTKKIILVDEVDGIAGREDAGGISALKKIISESRVPIVMVANNPWDQKLAPVRELSLMIEFKRLSKTSITRRLKEICEKEGIEVSDDLLGKIAERSKGDLRSAIMDLQAVAAGKKIVTEDDLKVLGDRDRVREIFEALRIIFYSKSIRGARAALEGLEIDPETLYTWILDNVPIQITELDELAEAYDILAKADIYFARINRLQNWKLMRYAIPLMTGGVVVAKKSAPKGFQKFSFPQKIRLLQKYREEREIRERIALKISSKLHLSSYKANKEMLPYIGFIISYAKKYKSRLAEYFEFTDEEISYLEKIYATVNEREEVEEKKQEEVTTKRMKKKTSKK